MRVYFKPFRIRFPSFTDVRKSVAEGTRICGYIMAGQPTYPAPRNKALIRAYENHWLHNYYSTAKNDNYRPLFSGLLAWKSWN